MAEKKIEGRTVRYDRMPADKGLDMLLRVVQVLGAADDIAAVLFSGRLDTDAAAIAAIAKFCRTMDRKVIYDILIEMASECRIDGEQVVPGVLDLNELISIAVFALRTEFGSFFTDGAGAVLQRARPAA